MTNEEKAVGIGLNVRDILVCSGVKRHIAEQFSAIAQESALKMAEWKDEQPISELEGWHTEPPTKDGFYLVETPNFPKNCFFIIAEWDNDAKCFYDEATDNPIEFIKWKLVELK